jgi:hypothetical protein
MYNTGNRSEISMFRHGVDAFYDDPPGLTTV